MRKILMLMFFLVNICPVFANGNIATTDGQNINTYLEKDGTLIFQNDATIWDDENLGAAQFSLPASGRPDTDEFKDTNGDDTGITTLAFGVNELISGDFEMPHKYKEGSSFYFHVHFQGITAPAGGTDNVQWQLIYTIMNSIALPVPTTITFESAVTTQYGGNIFSSAAISGSGVTIGNQFLFQLKRISASADEYAGDALTATVGIHYEINSIGSRETLTK